MYVPFTNPGPSHIRLLCYLPSVIGWKSRPRSDLRHEPTNAEQSFKV